MIVTICIGSSCHLKGSREVIEKLQQLLRENNLEDKVELKGSFCMGQCVNGVCVKIEDTLFSLTPQSTENFFIKEIAAKVQQ